MVAPSCRHWATVFYNVMVPGTEPEIVRRCGCCHWRILRWNWITLSYSEFRQSLKTFLFGQWGHGAMWTVLTAPSRNIGTYILFFYFSQVGSWVSVSDPMFDPVLSFNIHIYHGIVFIEQHRLDLLISAVSVSVRFTSQHYWFTYFKMPPRFKCNIYLQ